MKMNSRPFHYLLAALCSTLCIKTASALAPPHPDFEDWESVHDMRRRLNVDYGYETQHINPEHCRYLSEDRCRRLDEEHGPSRRLNPSTGRQFRVLVLLIKFPENTRELPPREYYDELFNGKGNSEVNPVGSVKEWLRYNSLGKYRVSFDVRDWETAEHSEAYYAAGTSGTDQDLQRIFAKAMDKFDAEGSIDWEDGYVDDWGYLNHFVVLHSGIQAEVGDRPCIPGSHKDRLWSNGSAQANFDESWNSKDFYAVNGWLLTSAFTSPICNRDDKSVLQSLNPTTIGVLVHEFSHGFGLPDLYDQGRPRLPLGGIGRFGTMSSLQGWDYASTTPGYLCAYSRARIGWVDPIVIDRDGYYVVQPLEIANSIYQIKHGYNEGEYLYIENKQQLKWDKDVRQGGIVIYHVDETANRQSERGYPGMDGWPAKHYRVALVPADGQYHLEKGENIGDTDDFWVKGKKLSSGGPHPNTDGYQGGTVKKTGISIEVLSDPGFIMVIRVTGFGGRSAAMPSPEGNDTKPVHEGHRAEPTDKTSTGNVMSWILSMIVGLGLMLGLAVIVL